MASTQSPWLWNWKKLAATHYLLAIVPNNWFDWFRRFGYDCGNQRFKRVTQVTKGPVSPVVAWIPMWQYNKINSCLTHTDNGPLIHTVCDKKWFFSFSFFISSHTLTSENDKQWMCHFLSQHIMCQPVKCYIHCFQGRWSVTVYREKPEIGQMLSQGSKLCDRSAQWVSYLCMSISYAPATSNLVGGVAPTNSSFIETWITPNCFFLGFFFVFLNWLHRIIIILKCIFFLESFETL